jgi:hypothetical protein
VTFDASGTPAVCLDKSTGAGVITTNFASNGTSVQCVTAAHWPGLVDVTADNGVDTPTLTGAYEYLEDPAVQGNYRFYNNADSLTPAAPRAADNTVAPVGQPGVVGQDFRLRFGIENHRPFDISAGTTYVLEFTPKSVDTCANTAADSTTVWTAVDTATAISFKTNSSVISGAAISAFADDPDVNPIDASENYEWVYQNYVSDAADFFVNADIAPKSAGLWDFSLTNHSAVATTNYCFRAVRDDNTPMEYNRYPEIITSESVYVNLSLTSPDVSIDVTPAKMSSAPNAASISTNGQLGMNIKMSSTTADTNLVRTSGGQTIPTLSATNTSTNPIIISGTTAAWGWRVDGLDSFTGVTTQETYTSSSVFTWAAIPALSQAKTIRNLTTATDQTTIGGTNTPESLTVWYAASATVSELAGAYKQVIIYTALPNI